MPIITKPSKPPLWATNVGVVVEPTEPKKQTGWTAEKPAFQHMNWIHNTNYNWQKYFESYFDVITNSGVIFDETNDRIGLGGVIPSGRLHVRKETPPGAATPSPSLDTGIFDGDDYSYLNVRTREGGATSIGGVLFSDAGRGHGAIDYVHRSSSSDVDALRLWAANDLIVQIQKNPDLTDRVEIGMSNFGLGQGNFQLGQGTERANMNIGNPGQGIKSLRSSGDIAITWNGDGRYTGPIDNDKVYANVTTSAGASALIVGQLGRLKFYSTSGSITAGDQVNTPANAKFVVDSDGDMGLNTDAPSRLGTNLTTFHIKGQATGRTGGVRLSSSDDSLDIALLGASSGIGNSSGNVPTGLEVISGSAFGIAMSGATKMVLGNDGRFLFGGNAPQTQSVVQIGGFGGYSSSDSILRVQRADGGGGNGWDFFADASRNRIVTIGTSKPFEIFTPTASESIAIGCQNTGAIHISGDNSVGIGGTSGGNKLRIVDNSLVNSLVVDNSSLTMTTDIQRIRGWRAAATDWHFMLMQSNLQSSADTEFAFRGDGNAFADGTFSGGGADYAEYFDSLSGKDIELGTAVVLEGDKIRPAKSNETPDGVVRPNGTSVVVGNNSWNHWKDKYLKNDFGDYRLQKVKYVKWMEDVYEEVEVQKTKQKTITKVEIVKEGDHYVQKEVKRTTDVGVFNEHPVLDGLGNPVMETVREESIKKVLVKHAVLPKKSKNGKSDIKAQSAIYKDEVIPKIEQPMVFREPVMEKKTIKTGKQKEVIYKVSELKKKEINLPKYAEYFEQDEKVLNPNFDPKLKYIPPEKRPEKILVGLLGQIPIKKGQPVASSWKKMREINANVDMYFVK